MNHVVLIGRLTKDPELRYIPGTGTPVATFTLAIDREYTKKDGTKETVEVSPAKDLVKINKRPVSLSDTHPLWNKRPNECTDEEYKEF